jgi:hypothetical protein
VAIPTVNATVPRLIDVHPGYHREWAKLQRLELELSDLRYPPPPPDPHLVDAAEVSAGDLDRLKGIREARIVDLDQQIRETKGKLLEMRSAASAAVVKAARPDHARLIDAMVGPARELLAVIRQHGEFLKPAERDGIWLSALTARALPDYVARELESFLRAYDRESKA